MLQRAAIITVPRRGNSRLEVTMTTRYRKVNRLEKPPVTNKTIVTMSVSPKV